MNDYDFESKLAFSQGVTESTHPDTIRSLIPGCVKVEKSEKEMDLLGIDFVATLRRGSTINIDVKAREKGCSKYWKTEDANRQKDPEFALEIWSVIPNRRGPGKAGWTLDESKLTDYTLHVYDRSDCCTAYLIPFQILRMAFIRNFSDWTKRYKRSTQSSGTWESECLFVPASVVVAAITKEMKHDISTPMTQADSSPQGALEDCCSQ